MTYNLKKVDDNLRITQGVAGRAQIVNIVGSVEVYRGSPKPPPGEQGGDKIGALGEGNTMIFADGNLFLNVSGASTIPAIGCVVFD